MPRGAGRGKLPRTAQSLPRGTAQGCCVKRGEGSLFLIAISPPQRPLPRGAASHPYRQRVALSVRVERRGKSSPIGWRLSDAVNSIRSNTGMGAGGPTPKAGPAAPGVAGAYRRRYVEIDDCLIQNPAYSFARADTKGTAEVRCSFFSFQFRTDVLYSAQWAVYARMQGNLKIQICALMMRISVRRSLCTHAKSAAPISRSGFHNSIAQQANAHGK